MNDAGQFRKPDDYETTETGTSNSSKEETINNKPKGGIYLTQVAPTCSMAGCGGVSPESGRFRGSVRHRASVSGLPVPAAMAGGLPVPVLWRPSFLARAIRAHAVPSVWSPNVGDGGHDLPGHA